MTKSGVVVVGGGLAGAKVVQTLREEGYEGAVTLVGEEADRPYERPPLSKEYLQRRKPIDQAFVHPEDWYAEHDVDLRLGQPVVAIDRDRREVALSDGERLPYAHLVLATGSVPRTLPLPGGDLRGVHTLRRIADSDALRTAFAQGGHLVVIGGGWIGLEVAAAARRAGLDVSVLEAGPQPLLRVLGEEMAKYFAALHRKYGVHLRTGASVSRILGEDGRVTGVEVDGQVLPADVVVVGVGAAPASTLAEEAGLEVDNGILVDARLCTADPVVLAVGDVANATNTALGRRVRVEHWDNAKRQGKLAARVILGHPGTYDWQPYFYTDQFDLGMEYVGLGSEDDSLVVRGKLETGEFLAFWVGVDGVLTAAMNVNVWDVNEDLRALLGRRLDPARLADPDRALSEV